jgi:glycerophosphoryl diester phosphodiesterase
VTLSPGLDLPLTGRPIAHRGLWRAGLTPENSLAAFQAACAAGYGVELDVRLTADGEVVVFHDEGLERLTTESGLVEERTLQELTGVTLLGGERQTIPSLAQALQVIAGRGLLLVELKTPAGQEGLLEAAVANLLKGYAGPVAVLSFNARALAWLARRHPTIPRGLNVDAMEQLNQLDEARPDFLSLNHRLAIAPEVQTWRASGRKAVAWTVRDAEQRRMLDGLVDNVIFEGFLP